MIPTFVTITPAPTNLGLGVADDFTGPGPMIRFFIICILIIVAIGFIIAYLRYRAMLKKTQTQTAGSQPNESDAITHKLKTLRVLWALFLIIGVVDAVAWFIFEYLMHVAEKVVA